MPKTSRHRYRLQESFSYEPPPRLYPQRNGATAKAAVSESGGWDGYGFTLKSSYNGQIHKPYP